MGLEIAPSSGSTPFGAIRSRLPFVVDSVALAVEAGVGLQDALALAAESSAGSPIGEELLQIVADTRRGQPLAVPLAALKARLQEPMVDEFLLAIGTSHQLVRASVRFCWRWPSAVRHDVSHEIESAVGRAQVQLYYPATLLLVICMVAVVAPFVAPMWGFLSGSGK